MSSLGKWIWEAFKLTVIQVQVHSSLENFRFKEPWKLTSLGEFIFKEMQVCKLSSKRSPSSKSFMLNEFKFKIFQVQDSFQMQGIQG